MHYSKGSLRIYRNGIVIQMRVGSVSVLTGFIYKHCFYAYLLSEEGHLVKRAGSLTESDRVNLGPYNQALII